jgi:hypothetical protein
MNNKSDLLRNTIRRYMCMLAVIVVVVVVVVFNNGMKCSCVIFREHTRISRWY